MDTLAGKLVQRAEPDRCPSAPACRCAASCCRRRWQLSGSLATASTL